MTVIPYTGSVVFFRLYSLVCFLKERGRWVKHTLNKPCDHTLSIHILGVEAGSSESLAVSCVECRDIKLLDLSNLRQRHPGDVAHPKDVKTVFSSPTDVPSFMFKGEHFTIFVYIAESEEVLELSISAYVFTIKQRIPLPGFGSRNTTLGYVPFPHRLLVFRVPQSDFLRAISVDNASNNLATEV